MKDKKLNNTFRVLDSDYGLPEEGTLLYAYQKNETMAVVKWEGLPTHPNRFERGKVVEKPIHCPYHNITPQEFVDMFHAELNKALNPPVPLWKVISVKFLNGFIFPYRTVTLILLTIVSLIYAVFHGGFRANEMGTVTGDQSVTKDCAMIVVNSFNKWCDERRNVILTCAYIFSASIWIELILIIYTHV